MENLLKESSHLPETEFTNPPEKIKLTKAKRALMTSLLEELQLKPFESITVNEICAQADVHRTTLYKYYADKNDLLKETLIIMFTDFAKAASRPDNARQPEISEQVLQLVEKYHYLFEKILITDRSGELRHMTQQVLIDLVFAYNLEWPAAKSEDFWQQRSLCACYYTGALLSVIEWWLRDKMQPGIPLMARYLGKLKPYPSLNIP